MDERTPETPVGWRPMSLSADTELGGFGERVGCSMEHSLSRPGVQRGILGRSLPVLPSSQVCPVKGLKWQEIHILSSTDLTPSSGLLLNLQ